MDQLVRCRSPSSKERAEWRRSSLPTQRATHSMWRSCCNSIRSFWLEPIRAWKWAALCPRSLPNKSERWPLPKCLQTRAALTDCTDIRPVSAWLWTPKWENPSTTDGNAIHVSIFEIVIQRYLFSSRLSISGARLLRWIRKKHYADSGQWRVKHKLLSIQSFSTYSCEIDPHFLETPNYSRFGSGTAEPYVFQEMSVFKFPADDNISFKCLISLCNMNFPDSACAQSIVRLLYWIAGKLILQPPRCSKRQSPFAVRQRREAQTQSPVRIEPKSAGSRERRQIVVTKPGFYMTLRVETRYFVPLYL